MSLAAAAAWYAQKKWPIFPLVPRAKVPLTEHGFKDATFDPDQVREWWEEDPEANIGLSTGAASRIIVVDIDPRSGGWESVKELGLLKAKVWAKTGGGGEHWFYDLGSQEIPSRKLAPGIDLKSTGGYVVLAPSIHPNGQKYEWPSKDILKIPMEHFALPDSVKTSLKKKDIKKPGWLAAAIKSLNEGNRSDTFAAITGKLHRLGLTADEIFCLLEPLAARCGFSENDLEYEVNGICQRYPRNTQCKSLRSWQPK